VFLVEHWSSFDALQHRPRLQDGHQTENALNLIGFILDDPLPPLSASLSQTSAMSSSCFLSRVFHLSRLLTALGGALFVFQNFLHRSQRQSVASEV
jgi:hypothetical protein